MEIKKADIKQINQLLEDVEDIVSDMEKEDKQAIRTLQGESINIRVRFIKYQLKINNLKVGERARELI